MTTVRVMLLQRHDRNVGSAVPPFGTSWPVEGRPFTVLYLNKPISDVSDPIWLFKNGALKRMFGPRREAVARG